MSNETIRVVRDHDKLHLAEDRKDTPKESFKFLAECAKGFLQSREQPRIIDVGCATGDLLYFLANRYPQAQLTGMDVMPELIERAIYDRRIGSTDRKCIADLNFRVGCDQPRVVRQARVR